MVNPSSFSARKINKVVYLVLVLYIHCISDPAEENLIIGLWWSYVDGNWHWFNIYLWKTDSFACGIVEMHKNHIICRFKCLSTVRCFHHLDLFHACTHNIWIGVAQPCKLSSSWSKFTKRCRGGTVFNLTSVWMLKLKRTRHWSYEQRSRQKLFPQWCSFYTWNFRSFWRSGPKLFAATLQCVVNQYSQTPHQLSKTTPVV